MPDELRSAMMVAALLLATVLSAAAACISFDDEECGCGNPAVEVTTG